MIDPPTKRDPLGILGDSTKKKADPLGILKKKRTFRERFSDWWGSWYFRSPIGKRDN